MASFRNVTNEKSSAFEDADYDPDLEARLYAEIYYSNDNYQQDYDTNDKESQNIATGVTSTNGVAPTIGSDNFVVDTNSSACQEFDKTPDGRNVYPSRSWVFGGTSKDAHSGSTQKFVARPKQQRLLTHKDLWLPKVQSQPQRSSCSPNLQNLDDLSLERRLAEAQTFADVVRRSEESRNSSTQFQNRSVQDSHVLSDVNRSNESGHFSTQLGGGLIDCGNNTIGLNRSDADDNFSTPLRNEAIVNCSNPTGNEDRQFGSGAGNFNNLASHSIRNESRNIRAPRNRFNEARNFSTPFRSGTIGYCDITPVSNNSHISTPQFGRQNTARNSRIVTRSGAARRRLRNAYAADNFVAESFETDFNGEGLFNSYLADQVENFRSVTDDELDDLFQNNEINDHFNSSYNSLAKNRKSLLKDIAKAKNLAKIEKRKEAIRRRAERKKTQRELRSLKNTNSTVEGKYEVVSKKNKLKMREVAPEPVDISSDSDDSILEVPVPPKTPPPVIHLQDSDDDLDTDTEKSRKSPTKEGRKINADESSVCSEEKNSSNDDESAAVSICENSPKNSREKSRKSKNNEKSVIPTNNQEEEENDSGKLEKSRSKKGKKSAEGNREESSDSRNSDTDSTAETSAEPITEIGTTIPRETPKKTKTTENSCAITNVRECEDDSGKSSKNRLKKGKKSADENREETGISRISESDSLAEASSEPIADSRLTISRETPKKTKNFESFDATPIVQESEGDSGKSSKNRPRKGKKSAEESVSETDLSSETLPEPIGKSSSTISQKNSRETPKKSKNSDHSVATPNIQECEDDTGKSSKSRTKKGKKSADESREEIATSQILETSSKDDESSAATIREAKLQKILKDATKKSRGAETSDASLNPDDGNLIINCTEIQKGASSLEDIRKMREAATSITALSEDSMTESEANNWVNIAAGQANSSRKDDEICSISSSIDGSINPALWEQLAQENRSAAANSSIENETRAAENFLPIQTNSKSTEDDFHAPITNSETANSRKRQTSSSPFNDFDVPAVPEKRPKIRQKNSREQTMTEYFFKPMSKELQAFYNNPWGGEDLDVHDVQSRMPRNPNCWAILDADLQGPTSRRRRLCPRCKTDTHFGRKCPEKAKPPSCYMCGTQGHTESRCPHTMCLTCGRKYATYRPTCGYCSKLHCTICNGSGHSCENCPDLWRRYHHTTTSTPPIVPKNSSRIMKPSQNLSCCNCAKRGHDVTMCRQLRWSQHFLTPMHITSYTSGPMYEPSNNRSINHPIITDLTEESSEKDRYIDGNQGNQSIIDSSQENLFEESIVDSNIETIEISDDCPPVEAEKTSSSQAKILFRAGELDPLKTLGWHRSQKRLDIDKTIELTGILSGTVKPTFLLNWQKYFRFGVEIIDDNNAGTFITIACVTTRIFSEFERVIWQWLSRTDAEKGYLSYESNPLELSKELFQAIKEKLVLTKIVLPVVKLLQKIISSDITLKFTAANVGSSASRKNRRRINSIFTQHGASSTRRCHLITSLYSGNYVEKGDILLQRFRYLANERLRRITNGEYLDVREYLQFVYVYNEIFTFHQTEALTKALEKAVVQYFANNGTQGVYKFETLNKFPKAEILECPNNPEVDTVAESLSLLTNCGGNNGANIDLQSAIEPKKLDENLSTNSQRVFPGNSEISLNEEETENPSDSLAGVLMHSLGKKARKTYRRMANTAIKAANKSNVPRLQKIARALKTKIRNCTVYTDDIDELQREISNDLRQRRGIDGNNVNMKNLKNPRKPRQRRHKQQQINQQSEQQSISDCCNGSGYVNFLKNL